MSSSKRKRTRAAGVLSPIARTLVIVFTVSAAGCSADVTRFEFGSKNTTSSIPVPPEPVRNGYGPGATPRGLGLTEAPLPPSEPPGNYRAAGHQYNGPSYPETSRPPSEPPGNYRVVGRQYKSPPPATEPPPHLAAGPRRSFRQTAGGGGDTVEVQQGETLYSIGRRYGVPVATIKDANGLTDNTVRPGQRLVVRAGAHDRGRASNAPPATDRTAVASYTPTPVPQRSPPATQAPPNFASPPAAEPPSGWEGRYTMRNGDSLYGIALRHNVSVHELQRANGIADPTKVPAGTVLNVPGRPGPAAGPAPSPTAPRVVTTVPRIINVAPGQKAADRPDSANDADRSEDAAAAGKFRWPVRGRVIAGFGRRPDGTHNDGVNVSVPQGTAIHAAEAGRVAYAGNELKGYGNLVLVRHSDGWVSAYAHAKQILVRPGDEVRRGQVIAKSGKTGAVDQPQLHFELRQGSRPVDPVPHLGN